MSTKSIITSFPTEILQEILLHFTHLTSLGQVIRSHSIFHAAFQGRRSFILAAIFRRQTLGARKISAVDRIYIYMELANKKIKNLEHNDKLTRRCSDADLVTLREALWPELSRNMSLFNSPTPIWLVGRQWALRLISNLARIPSKASTTISLGTEIWSYLIRPGWKLNQEDLNMAHVLVQTYRQENRPDEAFTFQESVLDRLDPESTNGKFWMSHLFKDYRSAGRVDEEIALKTRLWDAARAAGGASSETAMKWAKQVVCTNQETGRSVDAVQFQACVFALLDEGSRDYVAWGRWLIQMHKRSRNRLDEILLVRAEVWKHYPPHMSGYFVWARGMCVELRSRGREQEAMKVEKEVWTKHKASLMSGSASDAMDSFHVRAAGASLARAYRRRLQVAAAERIETQLWTGRLKF